MLKLLKFINDQSLLPTVIKKKNLSRKTALKSNCNINKNPLKTNKNTDTFNTV